MKKIILSFISLISIFALWGCSSDSVVGTFVATDGQTITLTSDKKVEYSDPAHNDTSSGTWEIRDKKVYVNRVSKSGKQRKEIYAEIPNGKVDSLFFKVNEDSSGTGTFYEQIFTRTH